MGKKTDIQWTDGSWTPIRARNKKTGKVGWHCEHDPTGCTHCYSEGLNKRFGTGLPFKPGHRKDIEIFLDEKILLAPLSWKKPQRVFVCSMTDLFADFVPDEWIDRMFAVMALCPQHTFQVLTKRSKRMWKYMTGGCRVSATRFDDRATCIKAQAFLWGPLHKYDDRLKSAIAVPLSNVWFGVSTERQIEAERRIIDLLNTPAAVRFISAEPLLGPIDLTRLCLLPQKSGSFRAGIHIDALRGRYCESGVPYTGDWDIRGPAPPDSERRRIDWAIVGGESGGNARNFEIGWAEQIVRQCQDASVAPFVKQLGSKAFCRNPEDATSLGRWCTKDRSGGDPNEWPPSLRVREMPKTAA